jgi:hypothetical protein
MKDMEKQNKIDWTIMSTCSTQMLKKQCANNSIVINKLGENIAFKNIERKYIK